MKDDDFDTPDQRANVPPSTTQGSDAWMRAEAARLARERQQGVPRGAQRGAPFLDEIAKSGAPIRSPTVELFATPPTLEESAGTLDGPLDAPPAPPRETYPKPGVHVDPNTVDGDIDSLTTRGVKISAEIMGLCAEAIRIRDQHRVQIGLGQRGDAEYIARLNATLAMVTSERDAARREAEHWQAVKLGDPSAPLVKSLNEAGQEIVLLRVQHDSVMKDRDDARADYQALALQLRTAEKSLDEYLSDHSGPKGASMVPRATLEFVARERDAREKERDSERAVVRAYEKKLDEQRALIVELVDAKSAFKPAVQEHAIPIGTVIERAVTAPTALLHWARQQCARIPEKDHPNGSYVVIDGVTLGDLRAWTKAVDSASFAATQAADAAIDAENAKAPSDAIWCRHCGGIGHDDTGMKPGPLCAIHEQSRR